MTTKRTALAAAALLLAALAVTGTQEPAERGAARAAAEDAAAEYGYTVEWVETTSAGHTGALYDDGSAIFAGAYDADRPHVVEISIGGADPDDVDDGAATRLRFMALHEVAHGETYRICGHPQPPITGDRHEHVADAYAHLFLDAPLDVEAYGYTEADVEAARSIHAGVCE